jgi:DNA-binding transcriptional LysR family regulator
LAVLPTFGSKWLLPRLHGFYAQHTSVQLHIHSRIGRVDLDKSGMDAFIGVGDGHWPGSTSHLLLNEELVPIISPELAASAPVTSAAELCSHLLLQVTARPDTWAQWFHARGVTPSRMRLGPEFELTSHLIQAVAAGIGVGLVPRYFINDEIAAGTIAVAVDDSLPGNLGYYLVYPTDRSAYPPLVAFRDWLLGVAEES